MQGWLKIKAASEFCNSSERTLRSWIKQGLRFSRVNGTLYFKLAWLDQFMEGYEVNENKVDQIVNEVTKELL